MQDIKYQFSLIQAMRSFFVSKGFTDVLTPPMVENPGMETHIHPFEVIEAKSQQSTNKYLHTSPEFMMKELLAKTDLENIFTINYVFRNELKSPIHRDQFLMCEWYRKNENYQQIMDDCEKLILYLTKSLGSLPLKYKYTQKDFKRISVDALLKDKLNLDIQKYMSVETFEAKIKSDFPKIILPEEKVGWDDLFYLLFYNYIEDDLKDEPYILLYDFPAPLAALSTLKVDNPNFCERFEIYLFGIELCNCFNELTDYQEQAKRFHQQEKDKQELYQYKLTSPKRFLNVLKDGYPKSAGIALGIERLLMSLIETDQPFFD